MVGGRVVFDTGALERRNRREPWPRMAGRTDVESMRDLIIIFARPRRSKPTSIKGLLETHGIEVAGRVGSVAHGLSVLVE